MKGIYWRPQRTSAGQLLAVAALAGLGLLLVERFPMVERQPLYEVKMNAARKARQAFEEIGLERIRLGIPVQPEYDPAATGMIGPEDSPIASNYGHLPAKQTSVNPNFAAVAVELLRNAGVKEGDVVVAAVSGSFPAINVAVYAALEVMGVEPVVIASTSSSQFGASHPDLTWLDMERLLHERKIVSFRSVAASLGGVEDRAVGHTTRGRELLRGAIRRNGRPLLEPASLSEAIEERLRVIYAATGGRKVSAYINVGGGAASMGADENRERYRPGLTYDPPTGASASVAGELIRTGVPVINFTQIEILARRYGLSQAPATLPPLGEGKVFEGPAHSRTMAIVMLVIIIAALFVAVRLDAGFRLSGGGGSKGSGGQTSAPEQMV